MSQTVYVDKKNYLSIPAKNIQAWLSLQIQKSHLN